MNEALCDENGGKCFKRIREKGKSNIGNDNRDFDTGSVPDRSDGRVLLWKGWMKMDERKAKKYGEWIPAINPPDTGTEVLVELGHTYESEYTFYSIARYIRFDDGECHWCDNKYGYLEWGKYSDGRGGSSFYKVS